MDIAFLIDASRQDVLPSLLRPFGDSSLLELALGRLSALDAPCRKYVACSDRETRRIVQDHPGLHLLRAMEGSYHHLRAAPEEWICEIDPRFPLVTEETWWDAVEHFLAVQPGGLVSASRATGRIFDDAGRLLAGAGDAEEWMQENGAFSIFSRGEAHRHGVKWSSDGESVIAYEIPRRAGRGVRTSEDHAALEAVYTVSRLGVLV